MAKKISKTTRKKSSKKIIKKAPTKSVKKASKPKQRVRITISKKILGEAPEEYHFVLKDGTRLKSIQDLADALDTMHEDIFSHHVTSMRNDFANWVEDIFSDRDLGKDLRSAHNQIETRIKILQKLVNEVIAEGKKKRK